MSAFESAVQELRRSQPSLEIVDDAEAVAERSHDWWVRGRLQRRVGETTTASLLVRPRSTVEVAAVLDWAQRKRVAVVPYGLGSGVCGAVEAKSGQVVLDMSAMDQILEINEQNLTVTVQAGMRGSDFEEQLAAGGYTMGHFPQSIALSTVGGWCATRAAGQLSTLYGNIENMLLGMEVVLPGGRIMKLPAVTRSATGPDMRHLFMGSEGTLGAFTELTFRIHPKPESVHGEAFVLPDIAAGCEALRRTMRAGWTPSVTRLYDGVEAGRNFQIQNSGEPVLLIMSEGAEARVAAESAAIAAIVAELGGTSHGAEPVESWMGHRNEVPDIDELLGQGLVVDTIEVAIGWDRLADLFEKTTAAGADVPGMIALSGHVSHCYTQGANIYFTFVVTEADPAKAVAVYDRMWGLVMRSTIELGGTIAHHHGIGRVRKNYLREELGDAYDLLVGLKGAFDPSGIMNPGALLDVG